MGSKIGKRKRKATKTSQLPRGLDQCYGAMAMIMGYLPLTEQLRLQSLDKWWYNIGVSRVQWCFVLQKMHIFFDQKLPYIIVVRETGYVQFF